MAKRHKWELRVAGIREGGPLYASWHDAKEAAWRYIDRHHHEAQRAKSRYADQIGVKKNDFLHDYIQGQIAQPRPNLKVVLPRLNDGALFSIEVNRVTD